MSLIKLRFLTTADPISGIIRWQTDCAYSHVEFVLDDDWAPALKAERCLGLLAGGPANWTIGAHLEGGVRLRDLNYGKFTAQETLTVGCTPEQKAAVMDAAVKCIGSPYDVKDIAGILFHQNWTEKGHWICSVFVAEKLINAGIGILRIAPAAAPSITPRDVYLSPLLKATA